MKYLLVAAVICCVLISEIVCPPVNPQPVEGDSPEEDPSFGLEYDRYLREVVMALEEDDAFRKKLEETNISDIKSGQIAKHLDLVSHQIRERLDEIKRQEINRLRNLAREKMKAMNGIQKMDNSYHHHVDVKNPHSFQAQDLEKLIVKATNDLDELDKKRRGDFKEYEMQKEHERQEELKKLNEEERKKAEEQYEEMKKKHKDHPRVHHPGSKDQLEGVWEETDKMDPNDFNPKTFFKLHDIDGNGVLDPKEVEALFQKELDQVYNRDNPEDDMNERYEEMERMREHVLGEVDKDKDSLISLQEFLDYTGTQDFDKDEGWKTLDEEEIYTDEDYQRYEQMLREQEEKMRQQGLDPNSIQPGMIPVPHDPNVQQMQMPHGGQQAGYHPDMDMQQQQHLQQQQQHHQQQQQFQQQQQQQQYQQMGGMHQGIAGQVPDHMPDMGQMPQGQRFQGQMHAEQQGQMPQGQMHGGQQVPVGQMPQGQMPGGQVPQGQMPGGQMPQGQMPERQPIAGGPPGGAHNAQQGQPQNVQQGVPQQGQPMRAQPQQGQPPGRPQQVQPQQGQPQQGQPHQAQPQQGQPQGQPQGQAQPQQGQPQQAQPQQGQPQQAQPQGGQQPLKFEGHEDKKPMV